jgi:anti-anti-sigma factor
MSSLHCELYGDALVATFSGSIDRKSSPQLREILLTAFDPATQAVCDLADVTSISSNGYRLLLHLYHLASAKRGQVALVGPSEEIRRTLSETGLSEFFLVSNSLDEAIAHVCRESQGHASLAIR